MTCSYCRSENFYLKIEGEKQSLYCRDCGRWLKHVTPEEAAEVEKEIARKKSEIKIEGSDYERMMEKYYRYKARHNSLSSDLRMFSDTSRLKSEIEKKAMYEKALKLKELTAKLAAYDEIFLDLKLRR